jgi:cell division protein FtsB
MQRRKRSYARETYYILCILGATVIAAFTFWGPEGFRDMKRAQVELEAHRLRVQMQRQSNVELKARIQALKTDRQAIEAIARDKGFARPAEIIQPLNQDEQPRKPQ